MYMTFNCWSVAPLRRSSVNKSVAWEQVLSELVEAADINDSQRSMMHSNLSAMHDVVGNCERILHTPIPIAYTRHTSRFVMIWMTLLPYALWEKFGWATLLVVPIIGVLLLGINEIGIDVEEPFSLLPLEALVDRIFLSCKQSVDMQVCFLCALETICTFDT